jgi:ribosomal protein L31
VWTSLLTSGKKSALFLMNLFSTPVEVDVRCHPAWIAGEVQAGLRKVGAMSVECVELGG